MRTTTVRLTVQNCHEGELDKVKAAGEGEGGYVSTSDNHRNKLRRAGFRL
jgi:hypothetical protein